MEVQQPKPIPLAQASRLNFWALVAEKATFILAMSLAGPYTVLTALATQLTASTVVIGAVTTVRNGALFAPVMFIALDP
jgi:hypothetical protein